jgi:hypothetical protein
MGTVPVFSSKSAFDNCIRAVEKCDLFLGIITPQYGSGIDDDGISITHHELRRAIELKKIRWLLVHDHVVFARALLKNLGHDTPEKRKKLPFSKNPVLDDLRIIDMYDEALCSDTPLLDREGNWVQKFGKDEDALLFTTAQFSRFQDVEAAIKENLSNPEKIIQQARKNGGHSS